MVGSNKALPKHTLSWDPATTLAGEGLGLTQDVVDGAAAVIVRVPLRFSQICNNEGLPAADHALEQVADDDGVRAAVKVAHPHHTRPRILPLHGFHLVVKLIQLALMRGVATAGAIAEVNAAGHDDLARFTMLQDSPIGSPLTTPGAVTQNFLKTSLNGFQLRIIVEDVRARALPTSTPWLHFVRPA